MMSAAAGSAHHQPSQAFGPTPRSAAAEVKAQNAGLGGVGDQDAVTQLLPGTALGEGEGGHHDQRSGGHVFLKLAPARAAVDVPPALAIMVLGIVLVVAPTAVPRPGGAL
jgi:hypothetical protein